MSQVSFGREGKMWAALFFMAMMALGSNAIGEDAIVDYLLGQYESVVAEIQELVSIPSISALPDHAEDVRKAGNWVKKRLEQVSGLSKVAMHETGGHPIVSAQYRGQSSAEKRTSVLIYGHFDVQPVDPIDLWTDPPFSGGRKDGKLLGRGVSDDKGNMLVPILAVEAILKKTGKLPVDIFFLLEGQEEIGSPQLDDWFAKEKAKGSKSAIPDWCCSVALSADGGQIGLEKPGLVLSLRGSAAIEVTVTNADQDLHSGLYGGSILNPLIALSHIVSQLFEPATGKILVPGYYDDVWNLTESQRKDFANFPVPSEELLSKVGAVGPYGEEGFTSYERMWTRPSLDVVGMYGGFQGEGIKTVLPRFAKVKLSTRLVPYQTPDRALSLLQARVLEISKDMPVNVEINVLSFKATPYAMSKTSAANQEAAEVLAKVFKLKNGLDDIAYYGMGGSIPIVALLKKYLDVETTLFGFALADDNMHAPNEFWREDCLRKALEAYVRMIFKLGESSGAREEL